MQTSKKIEMDNLVNAKQNCQLQTSKRIIFHIKCFCKLFETRKKCSKIEKKKEIFTLIIIKFKLKIQILK